MVTSLCKHPKSEILISNHVTHKGYWHIFIFLIRHSLTDLRTNERAAITIDTNVAFDTFK